jgi:hypothetical protein
MNKRFADLSAADFQASPVWVPCPPDNDLYRPYPDALPVGLELPVFLAATTLTLADGTAFAGFATRPPDGVTFELSSARPQLFTAAGQRFGFWFGSSAPTAGQKTAFYTAMGKSADAIFPIVNTVSAAISRVDLTIQIPGFCYSDPAAPGPIVET